ncbi:MAG: PD-(D/E)XK nuclease family protein, partial [Methylocystis sp.]|nr:PD-(D/E)XK nuclease family protein [Methylocystis sp.]
DVYKRQDAERLLIGRLTHALLQYLPDCAEEGRAAAARRFLELRGGALEEETRETIVRDALAIVNNARFAALFGEESAPEVDIVATLDNGAVVSGRIDRLAIASKEVLLAEFKSGRPRAAPERGHLRQLALYRAALMKLYPDRRLRAFLFYTQGAEAMEIADAALEEAYRDAIFH